MWVLTEVSQAGESSDLQLGVVGESPTGSYGDSVDTVQHQDAVVTRCKTPQSRIKPAPPFFSTILTCDLKKVYQSEWTPNTAVSIVRVQQTALSSPTVHKWAIH